MIRAERGFTLIEMMFVVAIIALLAAIAIPGVLRARMAANESSAVSSLRSIYSAQQMFWASCGSGNYAPTLQNLGLPVGGAPGFIGAELAGAAPVTKSGYEIDLDSDNPTAGTSCNGGAVVLAYHATADPLPGLGRRFFGTNGGGAIFQSVATLFGDMPDIGAPPLPALPLGQQ